MSLPPSLLAGLSVSRVGRVPGGFGIGDALRERVAPQFGRGVGLGARFGDDDDDDDGDETLVDVAHAIGMTPSDFVSVMHHVRAQIASLAGFQEQPSQFALTSAPTSALTNNVVSLISSAGVDVGLVTSMSGTHFKGGVITLRAFKPGNTESGEIVNVKLTGREAQPEIWTMSAGEAFDLPFVGPWINGTHVLTLSSSQGAASPNDVQVTLQARSCPPNVGAARHGRAMLPETTRAARAVRGRWGASIGETLSRHPAIGRMKEIDGRLQGLFSKLNVK